jgi:hypothetical protein
VLSGTVQGPSSAGFEHLHSQAFLLQQYLPVEPGGGTDPISTNIADESTASKASPAGTICTVLAAIGDLARINKEGDPSSRGNAALCS